MPNLAPKNLTRSYQSSTNVTYYTEFAYTYPGPEHNSLGIGTPSTDRYGELSARYVSSISISATQAFISSNVSIGKPLFGNDLHGSLLITNDFVNSAAFRIDTMGDMGYFTRYRSNDAAGLAMFLRRSRGSIVGENRQVVNGDTIANWIFQGCTGGGILEPQNPYLNAAQIITAVDDVPSTTSIPGRIVFATTQQGSTNLVERIRISNRGEVGLPSVSQGTSLRINRALSNNTTVYGILNDGIVWSGVTSIIGNRVGVSVSGNTTSSWVLSNLFNYRSDSNGLTSGVTVNSFFQYYLTSTQRARQNFGVYSDTNNTDQTPIASVSRTSGIVTVTSTVAHNLLTGMNIWMNLSSNTELNGQGFQITSVSSNTNFTYASAGADLATTSVTGGFVQSWDRYFLYQSIANPAASYHRGSLSLGTGNYLQSASVLNVTTDLQGANGIYLVHSGAQFLHLRPNMTSGANNGIVQTSDIGIIYGSNAFGGANQSAFVIAPWNNTVSGLRIDGSSNVSIGTSSALNYRLYVAGSFAATTKSFLIDHPTRPGLQLQHGSLEGPENGVYVRGRLTQAHVINLPDYWTGLIDSSTITVNLTALGKHQNLYVERIANNCIYIAGDPAPDCFYTVYAERKDVAKLQVEF